ncbi:hypothetical protein H3C70_00870 [Patescibacteria group bacterium]|nr:hypothetical protein [Patescibacteria group bacterium]
MVVVAIIGILMAAGIVAFSNIQKAARDARRKADVDAMGKAKEQFFAESGRYTFHVNGNESTQSYNNGYWSHPITLASFGNAFSAGLPVDPINNATYLYYYNACHGTTCGANGGSRYCISARLEKGKGNCNGASNFSCAWRPPGTGTHYCVSSRQ